MATIDLVINASFLEDAALVQARNMNAIAVFTSDKNVLTSAERYRSYMSATAVSEDFGTASTVASFANAVFSQQVNPAQVGGYLSICYWRAASETVAASAAVLKGAQLSESTTVAQVSGIDDGSFIITIDGVAQNVITLNFTTADSLADIVTILDTAITGATVSLTSDNRIVITSATTGVLSTITKTSAYSSGTFVGDSLGLNIGATVTNGAASSTLTAETKLEAVQNALAAGFVGFMFIDEPTDLEKEALSAYAQANDLLYYEVFDSAANLVTNPSTNTAWDFKLKSRTQTRMLYKADGDRKVGAAYMSRLHTMNFNGENTASTMHLKELVGVSPDDLSDTDIQSAAKIGLDIYVPFRGVPALFTSGKNSWSDYEYIVMGYKDILKVDLFNFVKNIPTKLPQTNQGMLQLVQVTEGVNQRFVRNGFLGTGLRWLRADYFGNKETFDQAIFRNGYYVLAGDINNLSQADRNLRKSSVISNAIKTAGAIHSVEIITRIEQ